MCSQVLIVLHHVVFIFAAFFGGLYRQSRLLLYVVDGAERMMQQEEDLLVTQLLLLIIHEYKCPNTHTQCQEGQYTSKSRANDQKRPGAHNAPETHKENHTRRGEMATLPLRGL